MRNREQLDNEPSVPDFEATQNGSISFRVRGPKTQIFMFWTLQHNFLCPSKKFHSGKSRKIMRISQKSSLNTWS